MRILVLGSDGQLGRELCRLLPEVGHDVVACHRGDCDITDGDQIARTLDGEEPAVVINCAAYTKVDQAESEPDQAYRINAMGPRLLASECALHGAFLCHISTDFVFDGTATAPIDEWTEAGPLSVYGRSKLAGEQEVRALCPQHLIIRTSWLYGQEGPNFVLTMLRLARERDRLRVVADQRGVPTWTGHLAPALARLLDRRVTGTVHLSNSGETTWHGFAAAVLENADIGTPVDAISTADYPLPARRPAYSVLDNRVWRLLGEAPLPDWREGLRTYLASRSATGNVRWVS